MCDPSVVSSMRDAGCIIWITKYDGYTSAKRFIIAHNPQGRLLLSLFVNNQSLVRRAPDLLHYLEYVVVGYGQG